MVGVKDQQPGPVVVDGAVVRRPAGPWTVAVHALLDHLERAGFSGSPRAVSADGEDVVTYTPGESVHPHAWSDEGVFQVGCLLRGLHEATASFVSPPNAACYPWPFASDAPDAILSHRDTGPWNIVARDGLPVAFIDWVTAGPADPLAEIAATGWLNAQLHDDDIAERQALPDARARAAQLRRFADGYRLTAAGRRGLVTAMIEYAIRDSAAEAAQAGVTPEAGDCDALWAIAWRARSAAWMVRHRALLENALT
ncbi:aminoglycoside phosphotransferase family protein [Trebonia kvetii]|uniref:Aminoglycoside phosphotransferase family protein n=1 Tax=Trebonia kvetii TaxID=2480626 RepID=A0A6P2C326_9ACTN|nr:aminoglycoside phosphotransferase family protein [Trebonia kvetii]